MSCTQSACPAESSGILSCCAARFATRAAQHAGRCALVAGTALLRPHLLHHGSRLACCLVPRGRPASAGAACSATTGPVPIAGSIMASNTGAAGSWDCTSGVGTAATLGSATAGLPPCADAAGAGAATGAGAAGRSAGSGAMSGRVGGAVSPADTPSAPPPACSAAGATGAAAAAAKPGSEPSGCSTASSFS